MSLRLNHHSLPVTNVRTKDIDMIRQRKPLFCKFLKLTKLKKLDTNMAKKGIILGL